MENMFMKLKRNISYADFLQEARICKNEIWFVTKEGDQLNLKSVLSEYLFLSAAVSSTLIQNGEIQLKDMNDLPHIAAFLEE